MVNKTARVALVVDSSCDATPEQVAQMNLIVVPLHVSFGDTHYTDGVDLPAPAFYEKVANSDIFPKTSQPTPAEYLNAFTEGLETAEEVVCITLSSKLSGTYESASIARSFMDPDQQERVHIFDSLSVTIGEMVFIGIASRLVEEGKTARLIMDALENIRPHVRIVAMLDTLDYLKKGGRIPAGVAVAGKLLSVKPVIAVEGGKVVMLGFARGSKNRNNMIIKAIHKYGGADYDRPIQFGYSGLSDSLLQKYLQDNEELYGTYSKNLPITCVGPTIGTHVGPGAIAFAFVSKK